MIRLNKYISNSGLCNRREADEYIVDGRVLVDNEIVSRLGVKVKLDSEVRVDNKIIVPYSFEYVVLNKPVDFAFKSKKNIFDLLKSSGISKLESLEPIEDDFKGLVLFSNDPNLIENFNINVFRIKQLFHITLKNPLSNHKLKLLKEKLIDKLKIVSINFVDDAKKNEIGLELLTNSHFNIISLFENLNNEIISLDRVMIGNVTKENLKRGKWRFLNKNEIISFKSF